MCSRTCFAFPSILLKNILGRYAKLNQFTSAIGSLVIPKKPLPQKVIQTTER